MPNLLRRAVVAVAAAAAGLMAVSVPAAHAATLPPPANRSAEWAGYYSVTAKDTPPLWASVEFTVPKNVSCRNSQGIPPYFGAMWVGIGGMGANGIDPGGQALLEQDGIGVQCADNKPTTQPVFYPWWEVAGINKQQAWYKDKAKKHVETVQPGDDIIATVTSPAYSESNSGKWQFTVTDYTSNQTWTYSYKIPPHQYTGATVEAITEWPDSSVCAPGSAGQLCRKTNKKKGAVRGGLVDLGEVDYYYADYGTADSSLLSIPQTYIDLYTGTREMMYPTGLYTSPGSDTADDAFSTMYKSDWTRAFPK